MISIYNSIYLSYYRADVMYVLPCARSILIYPIMLPPSFTPAAIAGVIDLLRTQGSFPLSVRYALQDKRSR